ncbi:sigma-E factor regulatory protein RseB domain-containing protein [Desulfitobacterium sp.]|uniref:sigma-E factor regulatory protein RseB domain-containing protein n=1 Tax=Desulfitobacterium sp. TaxID=49981 RepID=UPI002BEA650E|nr:sigma-E factor regulatory protein RseB domain-containing protein [Desulfitobacterium sp.]HVJ47820.1 sigma-E factor regulatory protein RseB domain-containing protein [Desulfitobacterium sp.]
MQPNNKELLLLPLYLNPQDFDLQKEATRVQHYPHKIVGQNSIAGRTATRIEIDPPGGLPYYLWIDTKTHLPV